MNKKVLTFIVIILLTIVACKKNSLPDGQFIGTWISDDKTDTLYFIDDQTFKQTAYDRVLHSYAYSYTEDSITIQYAGPNMILVRPSTHQYTLAHSTLILDLYKVNYGFSQTKMTLHRQ